MECVVDAGIWIDLRHGDLLQEVFDLGLSLVSPDAIVDQLKHIDVAQLERAGLIIKSLGSADVEGIAESMASHPALGYEDVCALYLAEQHGIVLLTGDRMLRELAKRRGRSEVHGILWVLDQLVASRIIAPQRAVESLTCILEHGSWLPEDECELRFKRWSAP